MKKQSDSFETLFINSHQAKSVTEALVKEECLQIKLNYRDFAITMQTPGDERYLARGLLFSEGVNSADFLNFKLIQHPHGKTADIQIQATANPAYQRQLRATAACGVCGAKNIDHLFETLSPVTKTMQIHSVDISSYYEAVSKQQALFKKTGGCHACGLFNQHGELLCVFEDIGRHNAVDKAIGFLLEESRLKDAYLMTVSGRVSFEIIQKCATANIPILLAISAPSSLAVTYASKANVTLVAFCRQERATVYSHTSRILTPCFDT